MLLLFSLLGNINYITVLWTNVSLLVMCRECGWRSSDSLTTSIDPCAVCLERKCTVAAEGTYLLKFANCIQLEYNIRF